jgi:hypothetical protein
MKAAAGRARAIAVLVQVLVRGETLVPEPAAGTVLIARC